MAVDLDEPADDEPKAPPAPEGWRCDSLDRAAWAARKLAVLYDQIKEIDQTHDMERHRLASWHSRQTVSRQRQALFFESALGDYAKHRYEETGETSVELPGGIVVAYTQPRKLLNVTDPKALVEQLESLGLHDCLSYSGPQLRLTGLNERAIVMEDDGRVFVRKPNSDEAVELVGVTAADRSRRPVVKTL